SPIAGRKQLAEIVGFNSAHKIIESLRLPRRIRMDVVLGAEAIRHALLFLREPRRRRQREVRRDIAGVVQEGSAGIELLVRAAAIDERIDVRRSAPEFDPTPEGGVEV